MHHQDEGFILRQTAYSETSRIVTWLTLHNGIIRTMAKGAVRPKQRFYGKLDSFLHCRLSYRPSRSSNLHSLTEVQLIDANIHIRQDYLKTLCLTYFFEIITCLAEPDAPILEFYETFRLAADYLKTHAVSERFIARYETRIAELAGWSGGGGGSRELEEHTRLTKSKRPLHRELSKLALTNSV